MPVKEWLQIGGTPPVAPPPPPPPPPLMANVGASSIRLGVGQTATIFFVWNDVVIGFDSADIQVTGGTLGALAQVNPTNFTALFTPTPNVTTTATIQVPQSGTSGASYSNAAGDPTQASNIQSISVHTSTGGPTAVFSLGVNLSGAENSIPNFPNTTQINYYAAQGFKEIRLPILWSAFPLNGTRVGIQPSSLAALDSGYCANLDATIAAIAGAGMKCLIDLHMFGTGPDGDVANSGGTSIAAFADLWGKISARYKGNAGVYGYDLMNEWHNDYDSSVILAANQAAINAIRANSDTTAIYAEGTHYSSVWDWATSTTFNNANLYQLNDPLNNLRFSGHNYYDYDGSGIHFSYAIETAKVGAAPPGDTVGPNIGIDRLTPFLAWCNLHGVTPHYGEFATSADYLTAGGNDNYTAWNLILKNTLDYCVTNKIECTVWGGGDFSTSYPFCLDPTSTLNNGQKDYTTAGLQATQMVILQQYLTFTGAQPIAYRVDLPVTVTSSGNPEAPIVTKVLYGTVGVASDNFTVRYNGKITSTVTITPYAHYVDDTSAGGTFTPSTITLAAGNNAIAYFTYTPANAGTLKIGATNNAGWIDPQVLAYSTTADNFHSVAVTPDNIYQPVRRIYGPYIGPAIQLQRSTDNATMDFSLNIRGDLPRQAIQDWTNSRSIPISKIYGVTGNDMTFALGAQPTLTLVNAQGYPEITWPLGLLNTFQSQSSGKGQQTVLVRAFNLNSNVLISQDNFNTGFRLNGSQYTVAPNDGNGVNVTSVFTGQLTNEWDYIAGTWSDLYSTNNVKTYKNGTLNAQANAALTFTFNPAFALADTSFGGFRFGGQNWQGSWTEAVITYEEYNSTLVAAFASSASTYYGIALPDTLTAVNPTIAGAVAGNGVVGKTYAPFPGVTISDGNSGSPTDSVTITLTGTAGGTLAGTGLSGSGPYTIAAASASSVTTTLRGLIFTTAGAAGTSETFTIAVTSSAGTSANNNATVVTMTAAGAETPFSAPVGTFTPRGTAAFKGVNISGGDLNYPSPNQFNYIYPQNTEVDYFAGKGMGLIRMTLSMRRLQPASYGPLDPVAFTRSDGLIGRADEPAENADAAVGTQTNLVAMKRVIDRAFTHNMYVLLDPHNFGTLFDTLDSVNRFVGPDAEANLQFADWWTRIATKFKNYPNVIWGLMNEPNGMTAADNKTGMVAGINAIAAVTTAQWVFIPGTFYSGANSWTSSGNAAAWAGYVKPAGLSIAFEMHQYLDPSNSGTQTTVVAGKGSTCLDVDSATTWARTNSFVCFLGETGWSPNDSQPSGGVPSVEGGAIMDYMNTNNDVWMGWSYWLGGSSAFYGSYIYSVVPSGYPTGPFTDTNQMSILVSHL